MNMTLYTFFIVISILQLFVILIILNKKYSWLGSWLLTKIDGMLTESKEYGLWSTVRFGFFISVMMSNFVIWMGILVLLIIKKDFPVVSSELIYLYAASNGIAGTVKVLQKMFEKKNGVVVDETTGDDKKTDGNQETVNK